MNSTQKPVSPPVQSPISTCHLVHAHLEAAYRALEKGRGSIPEKHWNQIIGLGHLMWQAVVDLRLEYDALQALSDPDFQAFKMGLLPKPKARRRKAKAV